MKTQTLTRDLYQKTRLYWALLKAQRSKKPVPVITNLYPTGACQARCVYCYVEMVGENDHLTSEQRKAKRETLREFTFDQWKKVIDSLSTLGYLEDHGGFHDRETGIGYLSRMRT